MGDKSHAHDHRSRKKNTWQNSTSTHEKDSQQTGIEGNFYNLIKGIYEKPTS